MKKTFLYILLSGTVAMTACKKNFLEREPLDGYSESSLWGSDKDALAAINGCYKDWESGLHLIYLDCGSDNAYNPYPWEGYTVLGSGNLTPNDVGDQRWSYTVVQKCNWFLAGVEQAKMDDKLRARLKGEARFLRAYQYFILTQLYGDVPLITANITPAEANKSTRTPKAEVVKFIMDELTAIVPDLPASYTGSDVGRITSGAALALKARMALFTKQYDVCITACNDIVKTGTYKLYPVYGDLFRIQHKNNSEIILDVQYKENDVPFESLGVMPPGSAGGWCSIDPLQALVDAYEMKNGKTIDDATSGYDEDNPYTNRDPRLAATVIYPGAMYNGSYYNPINEASSDYYAPYGNSKSGYLVRKFTTDLNDYADMWNVGLNIIAIRYAEVLLSLAEAKIELNQLDNTMYDALDAVRTRAGMPVVDRAVYNSQTKLRELVRRERRVELAMEGLRWFDIQRWEIGDKVMKGTVYGARLGNVDATTGKLTLGKDRILVEQRTFDIKKNYLWPIPQSERDINPGLTQNPLY